MVLFEIVSTQPKETTHPEIMRFAWQNAWRTEGVNCEIPPFPATLKDVKEYEKAGALPFYIPPELDTAYIFRIFGVDGDIVSRVPQFRDVSSHTGWRWIHIGNDYPHHSLSEEEALRELQSKGYEGLTLGEDVIAAGMNRRYLRGNVPGSGVWTRLTETKVDGHSLNVFRYPTGETIASTADWRNVRVRHVITRWSKPIGA